MGARRRSQFDGGVDARLLALGGLLWLALVLVGTELVQYSRHTLAASGRWVSSKPLMQMTLMGVERFQTTRNALHGNRLRLGEWHGFNELHLAEPLRPAVLEYRFRLDPGAHLSFIVERSEAGQTGLRLSRDPRFPSQWYRADRGGRFVARTVLDAPEGRLAGGWHLLRLRLGGGSLRGTLDGEPILTAPPTSEGAQFLGLRSGERPADVASVRALGAAGEVLLDEPFRNRRRSGALAVRVAGLSLIPVALGALPMLLAPTRTGARGAALRWLATLGLALCLLAMLSAFDHAYWSSRYVYDDFQPGGQRALPAAVRLEAWRERLFGTEDARSAVPDALRRSLTSWDGGPWATPGRIAHHGPGAGAWEMLDDAAVGATPALAPGGPRLAFLGTSQTMGIGAETIQETFVARTHARLAGALGPALETWNLSVPGSNSTRLLRSFLTDWRALRPDLLVVNLSNNDADARALIGNLHALALAMRRLGGGTVFVLEANSEERDTTALRRTHALVSRLGAELGVPVLDLHGHLASERVRDSGVLWWDHVHLTSHGQALTASWLAERLLPALQERARTAGSPPVR